MKDPARTKEEQEQANDKQNKESTRNKADNEEVERNQKELRPKRKGSSKRKVIKKDP